MKDKINKFILTISLCLFSSFSLFSQSVYMHEAQEEAEGTNFIEVLLGMCVFFGIIFILNKIFNKKEETNKINSNHRKFQDDEYLDYMAEKHREETANIIEQMESEVDFDVISRTEKEIELYGMPLSHSPTYDDGKLKSAIENLINKENEKTFPKIPIKPILANVEKEGYVDLGLSVKWASKNIGANDITDLGYSFRWGSFDYIENFDEKKILEYVDKYYPNEIETIEKEISGNPLYDTAIKFTNGAGRLPYKDEIEELINKCNWQYIEAEKHKGYIITGPNGKSIYIPLYYTARINCMYQMMLSIVTCYQTGTPKIENPPNKEGGCFFGLGISNMWNGKDILIKTESYFKKSFHYVRAVAAEI